MFASVMESLGNEALWKIIHILEEARLLKPRKGLKKKKKKKKTRARHNTQIGTYTGHAPDSQTHQS